MLRSLILISVRSPTVSRTAKGVRPTNRPTAERDETLSEAIGQRNGGVVQSGGGGGYGGGYGGAKEGKP